MAVFLKVSWLESYTFGLRPNRNTSREAVRMEAAELGIAGLRGAGLQDDVWVSAVRATSRERHTMGSQLDLFKNQFLSEAGVAAWATWVVFFLAVVRDFDEAVSGRPPWV
jgi:hypothetical protein